MVGEVEVEIQNCVCNTKRKKKQQNECTAECEFGATSISLKRKVLLLYEEDEEESARRPDVNRDAVARYIYAHAILKGERKRQAGKKIKREHSESKMAREAFWTFLSK